MSDEQRKGDDGADRRTSARVFGAAEAVLGIGLLVFGSLVVREVMRPTPAPEAPPRQARRVVPIRGLVEAEHLPLVAASRTFPFGLQATTGFRGRGWSRGSHLVAGGAKQGDWIELALPETGPGTYRLELFLTRATDYGIVAISLNGTRLGEPIDLWSGRGVFPTGALDLGQVQLVEGRNLLRIDVIDTNPRASDPFFQFGIDGVRLSQ